MYLLSLCNKNTNSLKDSAFFNHLRTFYFYHYNYESVLFYYIYVPNFAFVYQLLQII